MPTLEWWAALFAILVTAIAAARLRRPLSLRSRVLELIAIGALFAAAWLFGCTGNAIDTARASALIVLSYALTRVAVSADCRHLLPSVALAASLLACGAALLSLGICWLPIAMGLVTLRSARTTAVATFIGLTPAALALTLAH